MYIRPRRLWSTVTIHPWTLPRIGSSCGSSAAPRASSCSMLPAIASLPASAKCDQIVDQGVEVLIVEAHRRHQRARLHNIGIGHPDAQMIAAIHRDAGPARLACPQVRQVGAEASIRPRTLNGMAIDARRRFEYLAAA